MNARTESHVKLDGASTYFTIRDRFLKDLRQKRLLGELVSPDSSEDLGLQSDVRHDFYDYSPCSSLQYGKCNRGRPVINACESLNDRGCPHMADPSYVEKVRPTSSVEWEVIPFWGKAPGGSEVDVNELSFEELVDVFLLMLKKRTFKGVQS